MRGTLHLLATDDVGWLVPLLGPSALASARRRHAALGIAGEVGAQGVRLIGEALAARGPLTRAELADYLAPHGIPTAGQATFHLIWRAALEGTVCLGPTRGREPTYVRLEDWLSPGRPLAREAALAELARRYLAAYGPAGPDDLVAWSGLPMRDIRVGWQRIAGEIRELRVLGRSVWLPADHAAWLADVDTAPPVVRLLPRFDPYLLGYRRREVAVAPQHARRIHPGGGIIHPVLLIDGRAVGTWGSTRRRERLEVTVELFEPLASSMLTALEAEAAAVGQFLGMPGSLRLRPPPG
jgi:hypothetical protein